MPVPAEDDVRKALFQAIEETANPGEATDAFTLPEIVPVEAEWTGYRAGATKQSVELSGIGEEGKYREMMKEVEKPTTVLYFHGGAYYLSKSLPSSSLYPNQTKSPPQLPKETRESN